MYLFAVFINSEMAVLKEHLSMAASVYNHYCFCIMRHITADTDVFKTSSGRLEKVTRSYDQTKRRQDIWKKTSYLQRPEDA